MRPVRWSRWVVGRSVPEAAAYDTDPQDRGAGVGGDCSAEADLSSFFAKFLVVSVGA